MGKLSHETNLHANASFSPRLSSVLQLRKSWDEEEFSLFNMYTQILRRAQSLELNESYLTILIATT